MFCQAKNCKNFQKNHFFIFREKLNIIELAKIKSTWKRFSMYFQRSQKSLRSSSYWCLTTNGLNDQRNVDPENKWTDFFNVWISVSRILSTWSTKVCSHAFIFNTSIPFRISFINLTRSSLIFIWRNCNFCFLRLIYEFSGIKASITAIPAKTDGPNKFHKKNVTMKIWSGADQTLSMSAIKVTICSTSGNENKNHIDIPNFLFLDIFLEKFIKFCANVTVIRGKKVFFGKVPIKPEIRIFLDFFFVLKYQKC